MSQRSEHTLSVAFERAPIPMALVCVDGRLARVNDAYVRISGRSAEELTATDRPTLTHADDVATVSEGLARILDGSPIERFRVRTTLQDARVFDVTLVPVVEDPEIAGIAYLVDVTEFVEAEGDPATGLERDTSGALTTRSTVQVVESLVSAERGEVTLLALGFQGMTELRQHLDVGEFDALLIDVTARIAAVDPTLSIGRLGPESFLLTGDSLDGVAATTDVARRIRAALRTEHTGSLASRLRARFGALVADPGERPADLLERAADAMRDAVDRGELIVFADRDTPHRRELARAINRRLPAAMEAGDIHVAYQPILDLQTDRIVGAEALARWPGAPEGATPDVFVGVAEETGLIGTLGDLVLAQAASDWRQLLHDVGRPLALHVNVSPVQLGAGFAARTLDALAQIGLDPSLVVFELTEGATISPLGQQLDAVRILSSKGVRFAIDDFGSGHSWFARLGRVEPEIVKLDMQFAHRMSSPAGMRMASAVVSAAKAVDAIVVAEGISQISQAAAFRQLGCDYGQGYFLGAPLPIDGLLSTLRAAP